MKNMKTRDFLLYRYPCDAGQAFALKYQTMGDVYEALLKGAAGANSFNWAVWILRESGVDVDSLFLRLLRETRQYLPKKLQDIDPFDFQDPDGSLKEFEKNERRVRKEFRRLVVDRTTKPSIRYLSPVLAVNAWTEYLNNWLVASTDDAIRVLLLEHYKKQGTLPRPHTSEWRYIADGVWDEEYVIFPDAFQKRILGWLKELGNPFEMEMEQ